MPLSCSSTVGMGLFSSCLVLVVGLEEKKLERQMLDELEEDETELEREIE